MTNEIMQEIRTVTGRHIKAQSTEWFQEILEKFLFIGPFITSNKLDFAKVFSCFDKQEQSYMFSITIHFTLEELFLRKKADERNKSGDNPSV